MNVTPHLKHKEKNSLQPQCTQQTEQNLIAEEPNTLAQQYRVYPLGERTTSLGFWTDEQLHSMCVTLCFHLTDPMFTNEERMGNPLDIVKQSQELLNINTNEGTNILMVSLSNEEFLKEIVAIYMGLLEKDIENACALCEVLLQKRVDDGETVRSIALENGNEEVIRYVGQLYERLASISQTNHGNPTFHEKYQELQASIGSNLKNARTQ